MFVINTERQKNRQFGMTNSNTFQRFLDNSIYLFNPFGWKSNYSVDSTGTNLANSTTLTPSNFPIWETVGATVINNVFTPAIEEFVFSGNPYGGFGDIGVKEISARNFGTGTTYTNYSSTWRFCTKEGFPAGLVIGENIRINNFCKTTVATVITTDATFRTTAKLMNTSGTLTTIGTTNAVTINIGASNNYAKSPIQIYSGAGRTTSAGDRLVIETTFSFTTFTNATGGSIIFAMNPWGSQNPMYNEPSIVSVS